MLRVPYLVLALLAGCLVFAGGTDCGDPSGFTDAADCCACLAEHDPDGEEASLIGGNCLPSVPGAPNLGLSDEQQVCASQAGQALEGTGDVAVVGECLENDHPCASPCARAEAAGVRFAR